MKCCKNPHSVKNIHPNQLPLPSTITNSNPTAMSSSSSLPTYFTIQTDLGNINLYFRHDAAPQTCQYYIEAFKQNLFNKGATFYRSDFVIQCGLHGTNIKHPLGDLKVNETNANGTQFVSNGPGTASVAHWDVPDCGNTEFFINLKQNSHLDEAYGGYCVFAQLWPEEQDPESWKVVALIRDKIAKGGEGCCVGIRGVGMEG